MNKILILIVIGLIFGACTPDKFLIKRYSDPPIDGFIMKNIDSVDVDSDNTITLSSGSMISLRNETITETDFEMILDLISGEGVDFFFRTAVDQFEQHPYLKLDLSKNGSKVYENKNLVQIVDSVKISNANKLHIRNNGNRYLISLNCDTIKYGSTPIENSEFLIIRPHEGSKIKIRNLYINQEDKIDEYHSEKKNKKNN